MVHINRKYIDSHWLIFIFQGIAALLFGWLALFNSGTNIQSLIIIVGVYLLALSIIDFINALHRAHKKTGWAISVAIAVIDALIALALLFTLEQDIVWHLAIIAAYTVISGLCEIIIGFRTTVDPTDRFIWILCGVCGCIIGFVVLNSGIISSDYFVRFFGSYMIIFGICNLIYGIHNQSQKIEDHIARVEAAKQSASTRAKKATKSKKSPKTAKVTSKK